MASGARKNISLPSCRMENCCGTCPNSLPYCTLTLLQCAIQAEKLSGETAIFIHPLLNHAGVACDLATPTMLSMADPELTKVQEVI